MDITLKQFESLAPFFFEARKCVYLKSAPGRGKTATIEAVIPRIGAQLGMNLGTVVINGAALVLTDATGYLVPTAREEVQPDGSVRKVHYSQFTKPFWWITQEGKPLEAYDGGVIFIDEADKAGLDEKKILGEAALSGRLASHRLPPGWIVWMAGNRSSDRSGSTKELDHLINRRHEFDVRDDIEGWKDWAWKNSVSPEAIHFANENPQIVFQSDLPKQQGPWCTPRSLVETDKVMRLMATRYGKFPTDALATAVLASGIGEAAAGQFMASIRLGQEMPPYETIVKDPTKVKVPTKPDAHMMVCYQLAARVSEKDVDPVVTYIERLPPEFSVTFAKSACNRAPELVNTDAFGGWCSRNSSLMQAVSEVTSR